MNDWISVGTFTVTMLIYNIMIVNIDTFSLKCPSQSNWKFRAKVKCNSTLPFFCLYNNVKGKYVEGCREPDWDRKGSKRIFSGSFTRGKCKQMRYQPFKFQTDEGMSDCIYSKSFCNEEGQRVHLDDSAKDDRTCRCDYTKNYAFIITPRNLCYCIPTEEDCSCYIKSCPANLTLSADYLCIQHLYKGNSKCTDNNQHYETSDVQPRAKIENKHLQLNKTTTMSEWKNTASAVILCCLLFMHITGVCFIAVSFSKNVNGKLQSLNRYFRQRFTGFNIPDLSLKGFNINSGQMSCSVEICHKGVDEVEVEKSVENVSETSLNSYKRTLIDKENIELRETKKRVLVEVHKPLVLTDLTAVCAEEIHFLRIIHLLFRVACPAVRTTFNHEIQPNRLQKTLNENKQEMIRRYRKKPIINDFQWNLLFGQVKGQTVKTSEDFDIRLMIYILDILPSFSVSQEYQCSVNISTNAILSRIKYIRNDVTQSIRGEISEKKFNEYWDAIGQAVLILMTSQNLDIDNDQEKVRLIGRLLALSPINIDMKQLRKFIDLSEKYPALILQQLLSEYCVLTNKTFEDLLTDEKHQLHHKRKKVDTCCTCTASYSLDFKPISEKQWEDLYKINYSHVIAYNQSKCTGRFDSGRINTCNVSVASALVLNIPSILIYTINRLCMNGFDKFLQQNQHTIYHSIQNERCCKCSNIPAVKNIITIREWDTLFINEGNTVCSAGRKDCCCQYTVRNGIKYTDIGDIVLSKIFYVAGPLSIFNNTNQDMFLYFLKWIVDEKDLRGELTELLNLIEDKQFRSDMLRRTTSFSCTGLNVTLSNNDEAFKWISRHVDKQKITTEPPLHFLVCKKDGLTIKSMHLPKEFPSIPRTRTLIDITPYENNFLVVVYALKKIVYAVIQYHYTRCPDDVLEEIHEDINVEQTETEQFCIKRCKHEIKSRKKIIHLTQNRKLNVLSAIKDKSGNLDLKLMIYILKRRFDKESKAEFVDQLEVIDKIRREIVQSSSGLLDEPKFHETLDRMTKAIVHLGGQLYEDKLEKLHHTKHIIE